MAFPFVSLAGFQKSRVIFALPGAAAAALEAVDVVAGAVLAVDVVTGAVLDAVVVVGTALVAVAVVVALLAVVVGTTDELATTALEEVAALVAGEVVLLAAVVDALVVAAWPHAASSVSMPVVPSSRAPAPMKARRVERLLD
ncbi:MAG: hypothetical protein ACR2JY_21370 [Chloroflexota bacterium]